MTAARPKRLTFETREKRILDAAGRLFAERGYRGTTTRAIAEEAGVNEALLFRHFKSKSALYEALLSRALESWSHEVVPALDRVQRMPLKQALLEIAKILIQRVQDDPRLLRMMVFASLEDHRLGLRFFKKRLPVRDFVAKLFKERQRSGELRKQNSDLLAATYLSMVFYYIHMKEIFGAASAYYGSELPTIRFFAEILINGSTA